MKVCQNTTTHRVLCSVDIVNRQKEVCLCVSRHSLEALVNIVLQKEHQSAHRVGIHFLSDRSMRMMHKKFFGDASSTDCMSFPLDSEPDLLGLRHLGDVLVCPKTALERSCGDVLLFWDEITLYIVHGLLHLLGYDDTDAPHRTQMRRKEKLMLQSLAQAKCSLYPTDFANTQ
jgi:probable rRNA maturation factor